jgi:hypothetical protein
MLPFQLADASRRCENQEDEENADAAGKKDEESKDAKIVLVG